MPGWLRFPVFVILIATFGIGQWLAISWTIRRIWRALPGVSGRLLGLLGGTAVGAGAGVAFVMTVMVLFVIPQASSLWGIFAISGGLIGLGSAIGNTIPLERKSETARHTTPARSEERVSRHQE
jgi:hypothetical protein